MSKNKPYHIEAMDLGVKNFVAIKLLRSDSSAVKIREVWDYRVAGLTVDAARELIAKWGRKSFHPYPSTVAKKTRTWTEGPAAGRILRLAENVKQAQKEYAEKLAAYIASGDGELSYNRPVICWQAAGRNIITIRTEAVTWSDKPKRHWPTSSTVSYASYLIRDTEPTTLDFLRGNLSTAINGLMSEKYFKHILRGNWRNTVTRELLGIDYIAPLATPEIFFKKVVANSSDPNKFHSVFDDSEYIVGQKRVDKAQPDHTGGLYCYRTAKEATEAVFPVYSVNAGAENKVIVRVEVGGKRIQYGHKIAVSEMTVLGIA